MRCGEEVPLTSQVPQSVAPVEGVQGPTQQDQARTRVFVQLFVGLFVTFLIYLFVRQGSVIQAWLKSVLK